MSNESVTREQLRKAVDLVLEIFPDAKVTQADTIKAIVAVAQVIATNALTQAVYSAAT